MTLEAIPVQTKLTAAQLAQLETLARQTGTTVTKLIRAAVVQAYFAQPTLQLALNALWWNECEGKIISSPTSSPPTSILTNFRRLFGLSRIICFYKRSLACYWIGTVWTV